MKIILLSATEASLPAMEWLLRNGSLLTLLVPAGQNQPGAATLEAWADAQGLPCWQVNAADVESELEELVRETEPDLLLLYGFPFPISPDLPERLRCRAWNVHFGLQPMEGDTERMKGNITLHEWKGKGERVLQQRIAFLGRSEPDPIARLSELTVPVLAQALASLALLRRTGPLGPGIAAIY